MKFRTAPYFILLLLGLYSQAQAQYIKIEIKNKPKPGTDTKDTLYYAKNRKLKWKDFTGKPSPYSSFEATTFTAFGINLTTLEKKDTITVTVYFQTYFVKNASYVRPGGKTAYNLAHEQLHFDITHQVVQDFKTKLLSSSFKTENYISTINQMFLHFWRIMNKRQEEYDNDTQHGKNHARQQKWDNKIKQALASESTN